ncbi:MAG TPA: hypothetical protein VMR97_10900 [Acidimicrobiales bacterium]|nr:hypothetical protein [Acidimicrobiales bacterium]
MASFTVTAASAPDQGQVRRPISSRLAGLARAVEGTRRSARVDIRKLMLACGATCMGLGFVAIILGWYGAAHSAYLFQEVPYLISGGLLGVALVAGGGFLFFAAWLVRMMEENNRNAARVEQTLRLVDHVLGAVQADAAAESAREAIEARESTRIGGTTRYESNDVPGSSIYDTGSEGGSNWRFTEGTAR